MGDGSGLSGTDVAIELIETDGYIFFDPIPGDLMRTRETTPQVSVTINGIASRCDGNCSYSWSSDNTPTVTAVSPTSGKLSPPHLPPSI